MKVAFVFPGQGSQSVGMMDSFAENSVVQNVLKRASEALNEDLVALMQAGPVEKLNLTTYTQPVMLAASVAIFEAYRAAGGRMPDVVAGHSLGEYAALVVAGVISLEDAVRTVRIRADAMQNAVPVGVGGMAAILGLSADQVVALCQQQAGSQVLNAVNFNDPKQTVIAGHMEAVERACAAAKEMGAKRALMLPVSAPFHSQLMQPAADILRVALEKVPFHAPTIPVINNVDVAVVSDPIAMKDALVRQAWNAVRWVETIECMQKEYQIELVVESGPGKVLTGLTGRIVSDVKAVSMAQQSAIAEVLPLLA